MARFRFQELILSGMQENYSYVFGGGVNVLVGPVATGKTSMLELMRWTLGGDGILSLAVRQGVREAALTVLIGENEYTFRRSLRSQVNTVSLYDAKGSEAIDQLEANTSGTKSSSSFLMNALGIPETRITTSRAHPGADTTPITFWDVYDYLYVAQRDIDASFLHSDQAYREPKRRATFELLYGLATEETRALQLRQGQLREEAQAARVEIEHVRNFLARAGFADEHALRSREQEILAYLGTAQLDLENLQAGIRQRTPEAQQIRSELAVWEHRVIGFDAQLTERVNESARRRSLLSQLLVDQARLDRATAADLALHGLQFRICPRCWQTINPDRFNDGRCYICAQAEPSTEPHPVGIRREQTRLGAQIRETEQLIADDEASFAKLTAALAEAQGEIARIRTEIERQTETYVSPLFAEIANTSARVAKLQEQIGVIERGLRTWQRFRELEASLSKLETELQSVSGRLTEAQVAARRGLTRLSDLSDMFSDTIRQLAPPHFDLESDSASLDSKTFLPFVAGLSFYEELSSGKRTLINDAYHLAALRYSAGGGETLLPSVLVLDSPRKNFGALSDDKALTERLYRLVIAMEKGLKGEFQLLIADNDTPPIAKSLRQTHFSYTSPFVKDLVHPGPDNVQPLP